MRQSVILGTVAVAVWAAAWWIMQDSWQRPCAIGYLVVISTGLAIASCAHAPLRDVGRFRRWMAGVLISVLVWQLIVYGTRDRLFARDRVMLESVVNRLRGGDFVEECDGFIDVQVMGKSPLMVLFTIDNDVISGTGMMYVEGGGYGEGGEFAELEDRLSVVEAMDREWYFVIVP